MATTHSDAVAFLLEDHAKVRALLGELSQTTGQAIKSRQDTVCRVCTAVRAHSKVESELIYPAYLRASRTRDDAIQFFHAKEAHALIDVALLDLEMVSPAAGMFVAKAQLLQAEIERHCAEEEAEMFPRA